jgi:hypothetical protein
MMSVLAFQAQSTHARVASDDRTSVANVSLLHGSDGANLLHESVCT